MSCKQLLEAQRNPFCNESRVFSICLFFVFSPPDNNYNTWGSVYTTSFSFAAVMQHCVQTIRVHTDLKMNGKNAVVCMPGPSMVDAFTSVRCSKSTLWWRSVPKLSKVRHCPPIRALLLGYICVKWGSVITSNKQRLLR